jgi:hypothetical protein
VWPAVVPRPHCNWHVLHGLYQKRVATHHCTVCDMSTATSLPTNTFAVTGSKAVPLPDETLDFIITMIASKTTPMLFPCSLVLRRMRRIVLPYLFRSLNPHYPGRILPSSIKVLADNPTLGRLITTLTISSPRRYSIKTTSILSIDNMRLLLGQLPSLKELTLDCVDLAPSIPAVAEECSSRTFAIGCVSLSSASLNKAGYALVCQLLALCSKIDRLELRIRMQSDFPQVLSRDSSPQLSNRGPWESPSPRSVSRRIIRPQLVFSGLPS